MVYNVHCINCMRAKCTVVHEIEYTIRTLCDFVVQLIGVQLFVERIPGVRTL